MATIHVLQFVALWLSALYWSRYTLIGRPVSLWRQILASFAGVPLWVAAAYTATAVGDGATGSVELYGSQAMSWFAVFMALVMVLTFILSLVLWTEEEAQDAYDELASDLPGPQP